MILQYHIDLVCMPVKKHSKYEIMAQLKMLMALQIKRWPQIVSTGGAIVPTPSFTFLGTGSSYVSDLKWKKILITP